jgi:hypothetical protein
MVRVGCTERTLAVSTFIYSFACLRCVMLVSMHYRLCQLTIRMEVLQNERLATFLKRTDCWCMFSWTTCNQNNHFVRCIQTAAVSKIITA